MIKNLRTTLHPLHPHVLFRVVEPYPVSRFINGAPSIGNPFAVHQVVSNSLRGCRTYSKPPPMQIQVGYGRALVQTTYTLGFYLLPSQSSLAGSWLSYNISESLTSSLSYPLSIPYLSLSPLPLWNGTRMWPWPRAPRST